MPLTWRGTPADRLHQLARRRRSEWCFLTGSAAEPRTQTRRTEDLPDRPGPGRSYLEYENGSLDSRRSIRRGRAPSARESRMMISQGEVWWADLGEPTGSGPGYRRPVVVVQCDVLNQSRVSTIVCVPLTSNLKWQGALAREEKRSRQPCPVSYLSATVTSRGERNMATGEMTGSSRGM